ncbi:response regulator [Trinickia sp.]|uniref:response regulator n=1 Tax=Trinickia sp. TaxID=2571163 RepID=UPI003F7EDE1F
MSDSPITIVLIEDDNPIRRFVQVSLQDTDMRVLDAACGRRGLALAASVRPHLVILDLGLPDMDGAEVIRQLRDWSSIPVIVLSARTREDEKVAALDAGADDYLTKPLSVAELLARIRAHLRRQSRNTAGNAETSKICFGNVTVDLELRRVEREGHSVHLTPIEYRLLVSLIRHAGRVLTHRQLLQEVWGPARTERSHYLRIYMGHLRRKLERDAAQPEHIVTETGVGYRLVGVK